MRHGDFTDLAKYYINRPGYSKTVLDVLKAYAKNIIGYDDIVVADVGAGTGKLTEKLIELGLRGYAVEPNDTMRNEGIKYIESLQNATPPRRNYFPKLNFYGQKARLNVLD